MRLIDADDIVNTLGGTIEVIGYDGKNLLLRGQRIGLNSAIKQIKNAPIVEAEPIIHAHWIESEEGYFSCSNCHNDAMVELYENSQKLTPFCPYCGAIMNEEEPHKDCCDYLDENCNCRLEDGQCNYQPLCDTGDCSMCVE